MPKINKNTSFEVIEIIIILFMWILIAQTLIFSSLALTIQIEKAQQLFNEAFGLNCSQLSYNSQQVNINATNYFNTSEIRYNAYGIKTIDY
jgi:hypothetical protein